MCFFVFLLVLVSFFGGGQFLLRSFPFFLRHRVLRPRCRSTRLRFVIAVWGKCSCGVFVFLVWGACLSMCLLLRLLTPPSRTAHAVVRIVIRQGMLMWYCCRGCFGRMCVVLSDSACVLLVVRKSVNQSVNLSCLLVCLSAFLPVCLSA